MTFKQGIQPLKFSLSLWLSSFSRDPVTFHNSLLLHDRYCLCPHHLRCRHFFSQSRQLDVSIKSTYRLAPNFACTLLIFTLTPPPLSHFFSAFLVLHFATSPHNIPNLKWILIILLRRSSLLIRIPIQTPRVGLFTMLCKVHLPPQQPAHPPKALTKLVPLLRPIRHKL